MKRSIISTIEFSQGHIGICVLENLKGNIIEIHNAKSSIKRANEFLKENIALIEDKIEGKLTSVSAVIAPNKSVKQNITIVKESIILANNEVKMQDINNLTKQVELRNKTEDRDVILVQPLQYEVTDVLTKKYQNAPIGRKGKTLSALFTIASVSNTTTDFIRSIINAHNLKIEKMLLKPQTLSQNNVSMNALNNGAININIGKKYSYLTVNKNGGTVALMTFYEYGFNKLVEGISHSLNCTKDHAHKLLSIYGNASASKSNRVIYTYAEGIKQVVIRENDLQTIIIKFISRLSILSAKYLSQKGVNNLPIIFSGELNNIFDIENVASKYFASSVTKYEPMTYAELNAETRSTIGVINLNSQLSKVMGMNILSIVETNPNKFSSISDKLNTRRKKGIWNKFISKIGGYYERN